jgi:hypothetical protein
MRSMQGAGGLLGGTHFCCVAIHSLLDDSSTCCGGAKGAESGSGLDSGRGCMQAESAGTRFDSVPYRTWCHARSPQGVASWAALPTAPAVASLLPLLAICPCMNLQGAGDGAGSVNPLTKPRPFPQAPGQEDGGPLRACGLSSQAPVAPHPEKRTHRD